MSKFQMNDYHVHDDDGFSSAPRVVKSSEPAKRVVQEFEMTDLKTASKGGELISGHGKERAPSGNGGRDHQRFVLSQLAREALSVGKEEERIIETRVAERLNELSEKTREEAFKKGHEEGAKLGHQEAYQAYLADSAGRLEQIEKLINSMENAKVALFESNREFLMNVIYRTTKAVLLREIKADQDYLVRLARELIERSGLRENLTLKLHPSDGDSIEMVKQGILKSFSGLNNLNIEVSDHVSMGGCILETEWGAIDASLETQLTQVLETLDVAKGTTA